MVLCNGGDHGDDDDGNDDGDSKGCTLTLSRAVFILIYLIFTPHGAVILFIS